MTPKAKRTKGAGMRTSALAGDWRRRVSNVDGILRRSMARCNGDWFRPFDGIGCGTIGQASASLHE